MSKKKFKSRVNWIDHRNRSIQFSNHELTNILHLKSKLYVELWFSIGHNFSYYDNNWNSSGMHYTAHIDYAFDSVKNHARCKSWLVNQIHSYEWCKFLFYSRTFIYFVDYIMVPIKHQENFCGYWES